MLRRREVLLGGALTLLWHSTNCACAASAKDGQHGCMIDADSAREKLGAAQAAPGGTRLLTPTGDTEFNNALLSTLNRLDRLFDVAPGFGFFDDKGSPNAFASQSTQFGTSDGVVVYGTTLLRQQLGLADHPDAGIAAVAGHEYAHILQFKRGLNKQLTGSDGRVKRLELHADFLVGYFAGLRKLERPDFPAAVFASTQFTYGDNMIESPQHHGTPAERGQAVVAGYQAAFRDRQSTSAAIDTGLRYVAALSG